MSTTHGPICGVCGEVSEDLWLALGTGRENAALCEKHAAEHQGPKLGPLAQSGPGYSTPAIIPAEAIEQAGRQSGADLVQQIAEHVARAEERGAQVALDHLRTLFAEEPKP